MSTTVSYRGYDGAVIYDVEDKIYYGKILGIRDFVVYHGDTPEQAEQIFREAVDSWLQDYEHEGQQPPKPFASFSANLPHELQVKAALYAHEHDVDPENVIQMALTEFLGRAA